MPRSRWVRGFAMSMLMGAFTPSAVRAQALNDLVTRAVESDPLVAEAQANLASATARKKAAFAEHYPRFGVEGSNTIGGNAPDVDPELIGSLNLWAGGGIQAQVRSIDHEARGLESRLAETRENVAYEVSRLYLEALRLQTQISVSRRDLARHTRIVDNLSTVVRFDTGRQYDLIQAEARKAQVMTRILSQESDLDAVQARIARFSGSPRTLLVNLSLDVAPAREFDLEKLPSYIVQLEQVERSDADIDIAKSRRWPRLNVESVLTEDASSRLAFSWDALNFGTGSTISAARQQKAAATSLLDAVRKDLTVRWQTSEVNYQRALERHASARGLISSTQRVTEVFEKQFQIARRSMVDLLNAYAELSSIESATAQSAADVRAAALEYLHASSRTEAGVRASLPAPEAPEVADLASDSAQPATPLNPASEASPADPSPSRAPKRLAPSVQGRPRLQFDEDLSAPRGMPSTAPGPGQSRPGASDVPAPSSAP